MAILLTQGVSSHWHALGNSIAVLCVLAFSVRLSRSQARLQRMRDELNERESRYSSVVAAMREGVLLRNTDGVIYAFNSAAQQILQATEDELDGKTCFGSRWDVVDEQGNPFPMDAQPFLITLRTGKPYHDVIMGIRDAGGELKWISINTQPLVRVGEAQPYAVVSSFSDISERKLMQDALQSNEERYRRLVDNIPDVIWTSDATGRITYISPNVENVYGYSAIELYENGPELWMDRIHSDDRDRVMAAFQKLFSDNQTFDQEYRIQKKNCEWIWVHDRAARTHERNGTLFADGIFSDITARKRAEQELLAASIYTRSVFEATVDALVTIDKDGKIMDVNSATEALTGKTRDLLSGSDFCDNFTEPEKARQIYQQVFTAGEIRDYPLAIRHISGLVKEVLYNAAIFRNARGEVAGVVAAARDVTERKQLEQQLWQAQKLEAIGQLAGGVAHDFNNILAVILGYGELLQDSLPPTADPQHHLAGIMEAAKRASSLTRQLLAFSRKQVMQLSVVNLNDVITNLSKMLRRVIGENIELTFHGDPGLALTRVDPVQMEQVLMNLAVNAKDAMPEGGELVISTCNVKLDNEYTHNHPVVVPGNYVMLSVADTGLGMEPETLTHVFEPFFTTKAMGKGTGLGLSIIYGIVKQSGGYIWAYSEPLRGTVFKVYLPQAAKPSAVAPVETKLLPRTSTAGETILVVEDEEALASVVDTVLRGCGYRTLQASDAQEALRISANHAGPIDLLLTDVVLRRGMNGMEMAEQLRRSRKNLAVLFMSGYSDAMLKRIEGSQTEPNLLEKPFTALALRDKVREVLDARPPLAHVASAG